MDKEKEKPKVYEDSRARMMYDLLHNKVLHDEIEQLTTQLGMIEERLAYLEIKAFGSMGHPDIESTCDRRKT